MRQRTENIEIEDTTYCNLIYPDPMFLDLKILLHSIIR